MSSHAFHDECTYVEVDLTKPADAKKVAWPKDKLALSERGLGRSPSDRNASVSAWVESRPIPVGYSWQPMRFVRTDSEIQMHSTDQAHQGHYPFEMALYARYSPDRKHWSDWQVLAKKKGKDRLEYVGYLSIPNKQRQRYLEYLKQFSQMKVAWPKDQEAAVKWMVGKEPDFLEKEMPFIGYVQFHFQFSFRPEQYVSRMSFTVYFGRSGGGQDVDGFEERDEIRWRYRADGKSNED